MIDNVYNSFLHGTHDLGAEALHMGKPGWIVPTEEVGLSLNVKGRDYGNYAEQGYNVATRLNAGYGNEHGTIPHPHEYNQFAQVVAAFVARSRGCRIWIIGNEPNHENERKGGAIITPENYAECYALCREAIKRVDPGMMVLPAAVAPYHASPDPWDEYLVAMLEWIADRGGMDGFTIHAYTRTANPADVASAELMRDYPLDQTYAGFLTYRNALACLKPGMNVPLTLITEYDLMDGWPGHNAGIYSAACAEIDHWNQDPVNPAVHGVVAYRWKYDKWAFEHNPGAQDDIRQAASRGYRTPARPTQYAHAPGKVDPPHTIHLPSIGGGIKPPPPPTSPIDKYPVAWEPVLEDRGVKIVKAQPTAPDEQIFRVKAGEHWDEREAGGRHHIFLEVTTAEGNRMVDIPFKVSWPGESTVIHSRANPGERYAADFPMSKSLNEFSVEPTNGWVGDKVTGIGMGADGNSGIHTSTWLHFEYGALPIQIQNPTPPPEAQPTPVPPLVHPVKNSVWRIITQLYGRGVNVERYRRFRVDGVPLEGHNGVDFGTPDGAEIVAVDVGRVVESAFDAGGFGEYIKLDHAWGQSLYAHLLDRSVVAGGIAQRGQVIGRSNNSGNSTGSHLHFGIRVHPFNRQDGMGGYTDPLPYLEERAESAPDFVAWYSLSVTACKRAAMRYGMPWQLLAAQAWRESSFRPTIKHPTTGAMGLFQIMPPTWKEWAATLGVNDPYNPFHSAEVGAAYLDWCRDQTGSMREGLIAYGWGIGNWLDAKKKGIEPPAIWREYADTILYGADLVASVLAGLGVKP